MSTEGSMVDNFADKLSEHFESVIIVCTVYNGEDGTRVVCQRRGNYYATKGVITEWLEEERNRDLAEKLKPDEE